MAGLIAVGVIGKAMAALFDTLRIARWSARWLVAFSMVARGEIALVIATIGYEQGHVSHHAFAALILTIIALALLGPLMMTPYDMLKSLPTARDYLKPDTNFEVLDKVAHQIGDNQVADQLQKARRKLFKTIHG